MKKFFRQLDLKPELLNCMKTYKPKFIFKDMFAGLMVALVALPLNLAMGTRQTYDDFQFALQIGLWAAIVGGILLSLFGGTRFSIGGPTAPFIAVIAIFWTIPGFGMAELFFTTALAGVILIIAGLAKAGKLLKFISYPALIGICLGIGVALLFNLLSDLGFALGPAELTNSIEGVSPFLARIIRTGGGLSRGIRGVGERYLSYGVPNPDFHHGFSVASFILGTVAVLLVYLLPKIHKKIPSLIVAIAVTTGLSFVLTAISRATGAEWIRPILIGERFDVQPAWGEHYIRFGQINFGFWQIYVFAFAIAIIAALEGMTSATAVSNVSGIKYNANSEILGHGVANLGSGLLGGLPITAAMARTNLNYAEGAKSNFAGVFQAIFLLIFYAALLQFMGVVPIAALLAPLVKVAISTSFYPLVVSLFKFTKRDAAILAVSGGVVIFFGVHFGVLAGIAISFIVNIKSYKDKLVITEVEIDEVKGCEKLKLLQEKSEEYCKCVTCAAETTEIAVAEKGQTTDGIDTKGYKPRGSAAEHDAAGVGVQGSALQFNTLYIDTATVNTTTTDSENTIEEDEPLTPPTKKIFHVKGTVFFANAHKLEEKIHAAFETVDEVILDMEETNSVDATVVERLSKLTKNVSRLNKRLTLHNYSEDIGRLYNLAYTHVVKSWAPLINR